MKLIYLLRHAKSSWDDPGLDDFDRPLNKRGQKAARLIAEHFATADIRPAMVVCSPALRTRQTLDPLMPFLGDTPVVFEPRIYEASEQTLLARLSAIPAGVPSVLMIGHNPGLERLTLMLAGSMAATPDELDAKFPTGAMASLSSPADAWGQIGPGSCRLDRFVRPADLRLPAC